VIARHPLIAVLTAGVVLSVAAFLVVVLVVVPLLEAAGSAVGNAPGRFVHAYSEYWNGVDQQLQQARQKYGGQP
jgi:hypothetical protein